MNKRPQEDLSSLSMFELFRVETETQSAELTAGLLKIEKGAGTPQVLEILMRAAHSIKGAARIINLPAGVRVAHAMEDCFVAAQRGTLTIGHAEIDVLLKGVDLLTQIARTPEANMTSWEKSRAGAIRAFLHLLPVPGATAPAAPAAAPLPPAPAAAPVPEPEVVMAEPVPEPGPMVETSERVLRLDAENLNRLLGLAGESLVEARWIRPFVDSMQRLKRMQTGLFEAVEGLRDALNEEQLTSTPGDRLQNALQRVSECRVFLDHRLQDLDTFDRRCIQLTHRLYLEALRTRMRPFSDGVGRFPRMVRDIARSLGKEVHLKVIGESAQVDREILERLETPLAHLLRNAIDHGCELPEARETAGKPRQAALHIEARHAAGMLMVTVSDDGAGIDPERVREVVVRRRLVPPATAALLSKDELLEFLFLPGFTLKDAVTEISGRGVGLDVVHNMVRSVRGNVRIHTQPGAGTRFQLLLPITLSVLRTLLVEVGGEPYALPLAQIVRTQRLRREQVETLEGHLSFRHHEESIGLLCAQQVLDCGDAAPLAHELNVVILGERRSRHGLVVDRFLGERELVVQPLDPRLGKVQDISAAALMEDGSPVLIIDVDDLVHSIEKLIASGRLNRTRQEIPPPAVRRKHVLVVEDSLTVRELERKLLQARGYAVDVAVDGMDGWNALRSGAFDLVISDVDMPRLDGVELTRLIKQDPELRSLPVMIISYKDREEDRLRGLDAGADYYLTKGGFHDETLLRAVSDLIGEPEE